ncbi:Porin [Balamuthia mandrillaris]
MEHIPLLDKDLTRVEVLGRFLSPYIIEFIGTFFLVFSIAMNVTTGNVFAPFGIGLTLVILVFFGGHISGAHYNPAVTFAVRLSGRGAISNRDTAIYFVAQVLGGFFAALLVWGLLKHTFHPAPGHSFDWYHACTVEFLWTFVLASVVLNVATTTSQENNSFFGLAIGSTVLAGAITLGGVSGAVFNPAVGLGTTIVDAIHLNDGDALKYIWIYLIFPMLGGGMAAVVFRITNVREYHIKKQGTEGGNVFADKLYSHPDYEAKLEDREREEQARGRLHRAGHRNTYDIIPMEVTI